MTDNANPADPILALEGRIVLTDGTGFGAITNEIALDVPPPGAGFVAAMVAVPTLATSAAEIDAVNCMGLMNVVTRPTPFHFTCDAAVNPVPATVRVRSPEPAVADAGSKEAIAGTGLPVTGTAVAVEPPPGVGLTTVTVAVPAVAKSDARMAALICDELV